MNSSLRNTRHAAAFAAALVLGTAPAAAAEFSEAELYFELNHTDGDLGLHASIDGGPYTELEIEGPNGRRLLYIAAQGALARQGLTQLFFESAEPRFAELPPPAFFRRFPEGTYEISAESASGVEFEAEVELSHVMAAPASGITVSGLPAAENCDAPLPAVTTPVTIAWEPVTESHPDVGRPGAIEVAQYQFFVQHGDVKLAVELPPDVTEFQVPADVIALGDAFKFEIIARTAAGNNTAVESCFTLR